jgi:two-component system, sensor histidine kinase
LPEPSQDPYESDAHRALALFQLQSTPNGRFLHYCWSRSRKRAFLIRQSLSVLACGTMAMLQTPAMGLIGFAILVCSDLFDSVCMRRVWSRWQHGEVPDRLRKLIFATGVMESAIVGIVTVVMWHFSTRHDAIADAQLEFFGVAYLVGLGLNAGLVRPFVPAIARAKLAIILSMFFVILALVLADAPSVIGWFQGNAYLMSAILILFLVASSFLRMYADNHVRSQAAQEALLHNQVALTQANAEVARREQQARRLASIAESTTESIFVTDANDRIFWTNAAFTQVTGYALEDVVGRTPGEVLNAATTDKDTIKALTKMRRDRQKGRVEILNRFSDGSDHWIQTSLTPVCDDDGNLSMFISVERDITQEKQRIAELAEANVQVRAAAKAKERFFATMSHEIRTPMNGVLGMAELLSRTDLNAEQRGYLTAITQSGAALLGIINDILDLSKLQSGKVQVVDAEFDLAEVVSGVVTLLLPLAREKGIALAPPKGTEAPVWVLGDSGRVRQVVMNLVGNAIKFTAQGEVSVALERRIPVSASLRTGLTPSLTALRRPTVPSTVGLAAPALA